MFNLVDSIANLYSSAAIKYSIPEQTAVTRWTLMMPGAGCEYWKKTNGGCTMCGFNNLTKKYTRGLLFPSFIFKLLYRLGRKALTTKAPNEVSVFNGGNFWNEKEIPSGFQSFLLKEVAKDRDLTRLMIESRCDYVTEARVSNALEILNGKKLKIAIGLESQDDFVRNQLIRKGMSKRIFENKVGMARKCGAEVLVYVFLKPVGLDEGKALKEALATIRYALLTGATEIELSCAFIQEGTRMANAYHRGEFKPPYLWTILEIINEVIKNDWPVSIGGFNDEPPPIAIPSNCSDCSP
ncbi:MAG: hypothetical protein ABH818_02520 [Patescibacteria group bacterium]